jgi:Squalene-hopene cyclase C-terminal domain/Prenyltransferase and squalene oxidase repeat
MAYIEKECLTELRNLVLELGQHGGLISPSVYDTAQVLRLSPVTDDRASTVAWLIARQHSDGGWGQPSATRARDLPTLAASLALRAQRGSIGASDAAQAGFAFLRRYAHEHWSEPLADDLPVGIELLLPRLLGEAASQGIDLPDKPYQSLRALGTRKRLIIAATKPSAGSGPVYSWEGWGFQPAPDVIDGSGGVGHSPAATAAWLAMAAKRNDLNGVGSQGARRFLKSASTASCESDPGLMPVAWPINRFEQIGGLHALSVAGLVDHPHLRDAARAQILDLSHALRPGGIGKSDHFTVDGDCTFMAIATLIAAGHHVNSRVIYRFRKKNSFITYPIELQPSLTATAHAVLALARARDDVSCFARYLESKQSPDGRWVGDKWHNSWLYTTAEVIMALAQANRTKALPAAVAALLWHQRDGGGWGSADRPTPAETAYAALALHMLRSRGICTKQIYSALERAATWLADNYKSMSLRDDLFWISKELYCPCRIDRIFILSAVLALHQECGGPSSTNNAA